MCKAEVFDLVRAGQLSKIVINLPDLYLSLYSRLCRGEKINFESRSHFKEGIANELPDRSGRGKLLNFNEASCKFCLLSCGEKKVLKKGRIENLAEYFGYGTQVVPTGATH